MYSHRKLVIFAAFMLSGCATYGTSEKPLELPGAVLEDVCAWLITEEGFESGQIVTIPRRTVGIIEIFALHVLSAGDVLTAEDAFADHDLSAKLRETLAPVPVVPSKVRSSCSWKIEENIRRARERRELVLEISSPLANPYAADPAHEIGVFARLSAGTLSGVWYWIILTRVNEEWRAEEVIPLDISEN